MLAVQPLLVIRYSYGSGSYGQQWPSIHLGGKWRGKERIQRLPSFKDLTGLKMVRYLAPKFVGKLACGHVGNKVGG
jgi:hypothetical protein